MKGTYKDTSLITRLLIIIGISLFMWIMSIFIWKVLTQGDVTDINSLKVLQMLQSVCLFIVPPFALAYLMGEKPVGYLHLNRRVRLSTIMTVSGLVIIALPFVNLLSELNQQLSLPSAFSYLEIWMKATEKDTALLTEKMLTTHTLLGLVLNVFLVACIPAVGEELFFRGMLQRQFYRHFNFHIAIWLTAFIFSFIHFQFYGFFPRLLLGAFMGYLFAWSGSIWLSIVAHFVQNFISVLFFYLYSNKIIAVELDTIGVGETYWSCSNDTLVVNPYSICFVTPVDFLYMLCEAMLR